MILADPTHCSGSKGLLGKRGCRTPQKAITHLKVTALTIKTTNLTQYKETGQGRRAAAVAAAVGAKKDLHVSVRLPQEAQLGSRHAWREQGVWMLLSILAALAALAAVMGCTAVAAAAAAAAVRTLLVYMEAVKKGV
jgi:hypothetical protein